VDQTITILIYIRELSDSNLGWDYFYSGFPRILSIVPGKCEDSAFKQPMTISFNILSIRHPFIVLPYDATHAELLTRSINKPQINVYYYFKRMEFHYKSSFPKESETKLTFGVLKLVTTSSIMQTPGSISSLDSYIQHLCKQSVSMQTFLDETYCRPFAKRCTYYLLSCAWILSSFITVTYIVTKAGHET
jgi:hypothetical protein